MDENSQNKDKRLYWAEHKPNALITITPTPDKNFFRWWCTILNPFIKLTPTEIAVVAAYLRQRYLLSKVISDTTILDATLMGHEVRSKVMEECGITLRHLYVVLNNLKKNGVISASGFNPRLIPRFRKDDDNSFQLLLSFTDLNLS